MDLIIGAGITGLSYALLKGDSDYLILETENEIGGHDSSQWFRVGLFRAFLPFPGFTHQGYGDEGP